MDALWQAWWVFALGSAFFAALTTILGKIGVENVNSDLATAIRTVVILIAAWTLVFFRGEGNGISEITPKTWIFLILSGLATAASWICYYRALQLGNASQVAGVDKLSLVLIVVLSVLFLSEALTWKVLAGATLITLGTILLIR